MRRICVVIVLSLFVGHATAMFVPPQLIPVDRLVASAKAFIAKHPNDPDAHYTLARIYYLSFSVKRDSIFGFNWQEKDGKPEPIPEFMRGWNDPQKSGAELSSVEILDHAVQAKHEFDEAIRLDTSNGLYALGLASLTDEVRIYCRDAKPADVPKDLQGITLSGVRESYEHAFELSYPNESKQHALSPAGVGELVSYEAANGLVRLADEKGFTGTEEQDVQNSKDAIAKLNQIPMGAITPIVFAFKDDARLAEFLTPDVAVNFDLRGYGYRERWTWVKPTLGILVWDPWHLGKITSAQQLFGGYTFQIFRANGYAALAALDDNGDGMLTGRELDGISVWFDRNGNGVSDPGEVIPVQALHISAIATTADGMDGISPTCKRGIVLESGRALRSWDWVTLPIQGVPAGGRLALTRP